MAGVDHKGAKDKQGIDVGGWKIRVKKERIVSSAEEEKLSKELNIKLPGMLFGNSRLCCEHAASRARLKFDARGALKEVGQADPKLHVWAAKHWQRNKSREDIEVLKQASDWTFSTRYAGTWSGGATEKKGPAKTNINYDKLKRMDIPILFFDEVLLFEDELDDNGSSSFTVRIRAMPDFFFILARFFLRIDGVFLRLYDTRYYHEYGSNVVVRERQCREDKYDNVAQYLDVSSMRNNDIVAGKLPVVSQSVSEIVLGQKGKDPPGR